MAEIGKYNKLKVLRIVDHGAYLNGEELGDILIPKRYISANLQVDNEIDVFIYLDSEDRLIATTETPLAIIGDFALLKVVSVNSVGAFVDWGLMKDLLVPFREQKQTMEEGKYYFVYIYLDDESKRIVASAKLDKFLDNLPPEYEEGAEVDALICNQTDLGYNAIINNLHWGMLYKNEVFQDLRRGEHIKAYIKKVREDEKIDLSFYKIGYEKVDEISQAILDKLNQKKGFIPVSDKSPSEIISKIFGISKKTYKKAVGSLYKQKLISIDEDGIRLL
ncbi:MAG: S1-like domain-containing RNA-binding protein [Bacteroidota bacterium]